MKTQTRIVWYLSVVLLAIAPAISSAMDIFCQWDTGTGTAACTNHMLLYKEGWGCMTCEKPCGSQAYHCSGWSLSNCSIRPTSAPTYPFGIDPQGDIWTTVPPDQGGTFTSDGSNGWIFLPDASGVLHFPRAMVNPPSFN